MTEPAVRTGSPTRRLLVQAGAAVLLVVLVWQSWQLVSSPGLLPTLDFGAFWTAGRLAGSGEDPYDAERTVAVLRGLDPKLSEPVLMRNPPWSVAFLIPFGRLSFPVSQVLWLLLELALVVGCADRVWRFYGGPAGSRWLAWLVGLGFYPSLVVLHSGQLGPLVLLGLVGFLCLVDGPRPWLAGTALVLVSVKPHLVFLLWPAVALWVVRERRWGVVLGAVGALGLTLGFLLCFDPFILQQYRQAGTGQLHSWCLDLQTPTLATMLRLLTGEGEAWVQYVPPVCGVGWFLGYWLHQRSQWNWARELPLLLLVSQLATPYGWLGDQVVLLPALIQTAVCLHDRRHVPAARLAIILGVGLNVLVLALKFAGVSELWLVWTGPVLLFGYLGTRRLAAREPSGLALAAV